MALDLFARRFGRAVARNGRRCAPGLPLAEVPAAHLI